MGENGAHQKRREGWRKEGRRKEGRVAYPGNFDRIPLMKGNSEYRYVMGVLKCVWL